MPKVVETQELESLIQVVASFPTGALLEDVEAASGHLSHRTLQRRLSALVTHGRLRVEGRGKSTRYFRVEGDASPVPTSGTTPTTLPDEDSLDISPEAREVRTLVRLPLHRRKPVGYNRAWLEAYQPNRTAYLPLDLRARLAAAGHPPDGEVPAGTYARQILGRLLIDLSWNSSRLEGNTYSLLETERLLELGESAGGKSAQEAQMILNHKAALEMLVEDATEIGFNRYTLLNLHGLLADNLLSDPQAGGRLRSIAVGIGGTTFHPLEVPQLIGECFDLILAKAAAIEDPFEQSFFAMVHLPYLQPFEDVNKRVSRLAANIPLIRLNLCPVSFVGVPQHDYVEGILGIYELNRVELLRDVFAWAYERSCERYAAVRRSLGDPDPFRVRYRTQLFEVVGEVVREALDKRAAGERIASEAALLPAEERARFVEVAEVELQSLHEGNFARYRVRPSQFETWRAKWH